MTYKTAYVIRPIEISLDGLIDGSNTAKRSGRSPDRRYISPLVSCRCNNAGGREDEQTFVHDATCLHRRCMKSSNQPLQRKETFIWPIRK
ncbi:hypothetical protein AVEN_75627-1 [Araneus ventricosus]|uniref:Uncharacterized protein n=1 Tax=Araneus ventricosus TaxID=182803 RepID=A0A4Y2PSS2_ARAVE|nr:hypothetical protein AVEN_75627-1 [Araneus ventricosus]